MSWRVLLYITAQFVCGFVLHIAYGCSGGASWSLLISGVNNSPWEWTKPFVLVYLFWSFIEMSCHRPHLLHYVSIRILSAHLFLLLSLTALSIMRLFVNDEWAYCSMIGVCLCAAETAGWIGYDKKCRFELLIVPLLISLGLLFFSLLFCTLYPLPLGIFY